MQPNVIITTDKPKEEKKKVDALPPPPLEKGELDPHTEKALRDLGFLGRDVAASEPPAEPAKEEAKPEGDKPDPSKQQGGEQPEKTKPEPKKRKNRLEAVEEATVKIANATENLARGLSTRPPAQPAAAPPPVDDEEAEELAALEVLQKSRRYSGRNLKKEYTEWVGRLKDYRSKWEAEHPGDAFDEEADEHSKFVETHSPDIDEEDMIVARSRLESRREIAGYLAAERQESMRRMVENAAEEAAKAAPTEIAGLLDEKFAGKNLTEINKEDPITALVLEGMQKQAALQARLATQLFHTENPLAYNAQDERHVWAAQQVMDFERQLAEQPRDATVKDGRYFVTAQQYFSMPEADRNYYWTIYRAPDVVKYLMLVDLATQGKAAVTNLRKRLQVPIIAPGKDAKESAGAGDKREKEEPGRDLYGSAPPSSPASGGTVSPLPDGKKDGGPDLRYFFS